MRTRQKRYFSANVSINNFLTEVLLKFDSKLKHRRESKKKVL